MADYAGSSNEKGHSADVEPHSSTDPAAMSNADKISAITRACQHEDIDELVQLADSAGGLLNDSLRRDACKSRTLWMVYSVLIFAPRADSSRLPSGCVMACKRERFFLEKSSSTPRRRPGPARRQPVVCLLSQK